MSETERDRLDPNCGDPSFLKEFLLLSAKKTLAMQAITERMQSMPTPEHYHSTLEFRNAFWSYREDLTRGFQVLFDCMMEMAGFRDILIKHQATADDLYKIACMIRVCDYEFQGRDFLPVALVSFGEPLDYLLTNREKLRLENEDEARCIITASKELLAHGD